MRRSPLLGSIAGLVLIGCANADPDFGLVLRSADFGDPCTSDPVNIPRIYDNGSTASADVSVNVANTGGSNILVSGTGFVIPPDRAQRRPRGDSAHGPDRRQYRPGGPGGGLRLDGDHLAPLIPRAAGARPSSAPGRPWALARRHEASAQTARQLDCAAPAAPAAGRGARIICS